MRSMLISLILFCSLTQFVIADPVARKKTDDCGTIYACYAPEICTDPAKKTMPLEDHQVKEVTKDTKISEDCPAVIGYHLYTEKSMYVFIESFQAKEIIDAIEFVHTSEVQAPTEEKFALSCKIKDNKIIGETVKYKLDSSVVTPIHQEKFSSDKLPSKLLCEFKVKNRIKNGERTAQNIFSIYSKNYLQMKVTTTASGTEKQTKIDPNNYRQSPDILKKCDPSTFVFKKEISKTEIYQRVEDEPGKYYCADPRFKRQFKSPEAVSYEPVNKLECILEKFQINDVIMAADILIDIRCVADSKLFCKYNAKTIASQDAHKKAVIGPDMDTAKESVMKCPPGYPHLIIAGISEPIMNAKFECLNYGVDQLWTVGTETISAEGPEVYCTDELKCHHIENNTIPESSVIRGYLGATDFLPRCFTADGKMTVEDTGKPKQPVTTKCDGRTGQFKYVISSGEFPIGPGTKFECEYPVYTNTLKNEQNKQTILKGSLIAGGVAVALALAIVGIGCFCIRRRVQRERKRVEMMNNAVWLQYCADDRERKANNIAKGKKEKGTLANKLSATEKCNNMQLSYQSIGMISKTTAYGAPRHFTKDVANDTEKVVNSDEYSTAGRELVPLKIAKKDEKPKWKYSVASKLELDLDDTIKPVPQKRAAGRGPNEQNSKKTQ